MCTSHTVYTDPVELTFARRSMVVLAVDDAVYTHDWDRVARPVAPEDVWNNTLGVNAAPAAYRAPTNGDPDVPHATSNTPVTITVSPVTRLRVTEAPVMAVNEVVLMDVDAEALACPEKTINFAPVPFFWTVLCKLVVPETVNPVRVPNEVMDVALGSRA